MSLVITLLPLLLALALTAGLVKLAARLLGRMQVSWKHAWVFVAMLAAYAFVWGMAVHAGFVGGDVFLVLGPLFGWVVILAFGAWYFGARVRGSDGQWVRWPGGLKLTGLVLVLMLVLSFGAFALLPP
ncbi:MAG: hypothetical protein V4858_18670 [Pseudomonadota bacterium]